jgi:hypothetical protein
LGGNLTFCLVLSCLNLNRVWMEGFWFSFFIHAVVLSFFFFVRDIGRLDSPIYHMPLLVLLFVKTLFVTCVNNPLAMRVAYFSDFLLTALAYPLFFSLYLYSSCAGKVPCNLGISVLSIVEGTWKIRRSNANHTCSMRLCRLWSPAVRQYTSRWDQYGFNTYCTSRITPA